ncbi:MAG: hypothetical protein AVDCRST_MAG93-4983, partial [uncultured Chloroflexia bacterium]
MSGTQSKSSFRHHDAIAPYGLPTSNRFPATSILVPGIVQERPSSPQKRTLESLPYPRQACIFIRHHYILCLPPMPIGLEATPSPGP